MGYRLGYGGGYFDRTLAQPDRPALAIGVGLAQARLATIFPQPHDIPMDLIVTEQGLDTSWLYTRMNFSSLAKNGNAGAATGAAGGRHHHLPAVLTKLSIALASCQ